MGQQTTCQLRPDNLPQTRSWPQNRQIGARGNYESLLRLAGLPSSLAMLHITWAGSRLAVPEQSPTGSIPGNQGAKKKRTTQRAALFCWSNRRRVQHLELQLRSQRERIGVLSSSVIVIDRPDRGDAGVVTVHDVVELEVRLVILPRRK